jgi:AcrR family transcriptional regulator
MPKRVDHSVRRREITEAVVRITLKGGLDSATFREIAAEAGVSVRLVQYYFGTKDDLLLATQRHVAQRSIERLRRWVSETDGSPRAWIRAFAGSFIPIDDESRVAMLMYVALHTASLVDPTLAWSEALEVPRGMHDAFANQLRRGRLRAGIEPEREAALLTALVPSLAQGVLDGMHTAEQAYQLLDYALDTAFR